MTTLVKKRHSQVTLSSGGMKTMECPIGNKIMSMPLEFLDSSGDIVTEAQVRAEISNVTLSFGGTDVINASPAELYDFYEYAGNRVGSNAGIAGVVELNAARLLYKIGQVQRAYGFGTADLTNITVKVTAGTLSNIDSVRLSSERDVTNNEPLGVHCRLISYPQTDNTTGDVLVTSLPRNPRTAYLAVMASDGASGAIKEGIVKLNGNNVYERTSLSVNAQIVSNAGFVQPSGYFVYQFADGTENSALRMAGANSLEFTQNFSTAAGSGGYAMVAATLENLPLKA